MSDTRFHQSRRSYLAKISAGALAGGVNSLAGCTSNNDDEGNGSNDEGNGSGSTEKTLHIGALFAVTGPYAAIGEGGEAGAKLAAEMEQSESQDLTIQYTSKDSELSPETALMKAKELVENENVDALIGCTSTSIGKAISNYAKQQEIPLVIAIAGGETLTGENCNKFTFRTISHTYQNMKPQVEFAMENLGTKFATMGADYSYGRESVNAFVEQAEAMGGEVVEQVWPKLGTTDFSTYIQKIASSEADFLVNRLTGTGAHKAAKQINSFGLDDQMDVMTNIQHTMAQGAGDAVEGWYGHVIYHPLLSNEQTGTELTGTFVNEYKERHGGSVPPNFAVTGYSAVQCLAKATREAGSTNSSDLVSTLEESSIMSPKGPMKLRSCDHQAQQHLWTAEFVSPDGTDYDVPIPGNFVKHEMGTNSRPCEETGCNF